MVFRAEDETGATAVYVPSNTYNFDPRLVPIFCGWGAILRLLFRKTGNSQN